MTDVNAQSQFGVMAGFSNIQEKATPENFSASNGEAGFFVGGVADFKISERFHIQPEVLYANASDTNFLHSYISKIYGV